MKRLPHPAPAPIVTWPRRERTTDERNRRALGHVLNSIAEAPRFDDPFGVVDVVAELVGLEVRWRVVKNWNLVIGRSVP